MELPTPTLSPLDYRYCSLRIAETEILVGDEEPSRFIHQSDGCIEVSAGGATPVFVGSFSSLVIDVESVITEGVHPFDVFDTFSKTAPYYQSLYLQRSWSGADFRKTVFKAVFGDESAWRPNLLILDRLEVFPEHRGHQVGIAALRGLIERFRMGTGLIVMKPYPLQFESEPVRPEDIEYRKQLGLDNFRMGFKPLAKLRGYYSSLGFRLIPRTSLMGLAPEHYIVWLDRCRMAAITTPALFILAATVAACPH